MRNDSLCPAVKFRWNRFVERRDLGDTHYCLFFLDFARGKGDEGRSRGEVRVASFWPWTQREQRVSGSMISRSDDRRLTDSCVRHRKDRDGNEGLVTNSARKAS